MNELGNNETAPGGAPEPGPENAQAGAQPAPGLEQGGSGEARSATAGAAAPTPPSPESPEGGTTEVHLPDEAEGPLVHMHFTAPALVPLEALDGDQAFLVRDAAELDDVSALATDVARLGQLYPIDVRRSPHDPERFQVVAGFRRVAALEFLQRDKVLARLHADLSDADALLLALAAAIDSKAVSAEALEALQQRLGSEGRLSPAARDMLHKALTQDDELAPEQVEEEVDADELAADVTVRLGQCNQDLSVLADVFAELDEERREALLTQLRYSSELVAFLEGKR